ncbi:hypothetical protein [Bathymodiolus thermophilus thioautotrophic gill symbiont]|uniref:Uncharacterized protein n=1 Tax=Bathymodiolus thermophilus thioautotrophic gill symbiont TaxID=2360 RepID=A0A1J5UFQ8_9GAMM|nr:hypothetical protein [Bathymodiolus thermophilus thioautotrophic gill symbiont]OIR24749.1 hypothetical protein BGC33_04455 [Bathymodiolus thermophilus thioautotrophic gill symbiont]
MGLLVKEYKELEEAQKKLTTNTATFDEIQRFLDLMEKSGNKTEMSDYMKNIGFNSMDEFKASLNNKKKNEDLVKGLAIVGGAVLVAWLLTRK